MSAHRNVNMTVDTAKRSFGISLVDQIVYEVISNHDETYHVRL